MTTEREQAIRDCIAATKAATESYELVRPATVIAALESVLSAPDQAEASNPIVDKSHNSTGDAGALCERTVRACIEALPCMKPEGHVIWGKTREDAFVDGLTQCHKALEALLPKPDKAKELVESFADDVGYDADWRVPEQFARWLISTGRLAE